MKITYRDYSIYDDVKYNMVALKPNYILDEDEDDIIHVKNVDEAKNYIDNLLFIKKTRGDVLEITSKF